MCIHFGHAGCKVEVHSLRKQTTIKMPMVVGGWLGL